LNAKGDLSNGEITDRLGISIVTERRASAWPTPFLEP